MSIIHQFITINEHQRIGEIILDNPNSLNAQTYDMVKTTSELLSTWVDDASVVAVLMRGAGQKAFCAGGDIRGLYHAYNSEIFPNPEPLKFFQVEYGLCKQINSYAKPIIVWASGIVMGGGMGLATPCSHRIVSETTMMAMPEVGIGLFPDAGGSYFLKQMPERLGLFLGLTGARFNGADAIALGVADVMMASDDYGRLVDVLQSATWADDASNHQMLDDLLGTLHRTDLLDGGWLLPHQAVASELVSVDSLLAFDNKVQSYMTQDDCDNYIKTALTNYQKGCPTSAGLTWQIYHQVENKSFDEVMDMELIVALYCCHFGEFAEGVRALLIDKDKNPKWHYTVDSLPQTHLDRHFVAW